MKKKMVNSLLVVISMIMISGTVVYAATTNFTFVLNASVSSDNDSISKRTMKSGTAYESVYYVTPTYFTSPGWIRVKSNQLVTDKESKSFDVYSYDGKPRSSSYGYAAPANIYYYLKAQYGKTFYGGKTIVKGRYTP